MKEREKGKRKGGNFRETAIYLIKKRGDKKKRFFKGKKNTKSTCR